MCVWGGGGGGGGGGLKDVSPILNYFLRKILLPSSNVSVSLLGVNL